MSAGRLEPGERASALRDQLLGAARDGSASSKVASHDRVGRIDDDECQAFAQAEKLLHSGDDRVTAIGRYRGIERGTGHEVEAAFAHILTIHEGRIVALEQITDTAQWTP